MTLKLVEPRLRMTKFLAVGNVWHTHYTCTFLSCLSMVMFYLVVTFMDVLVTIKLARLSETFIANITIIWFIACVNTYMLLEIGQASEAFITHFTLVRFISSMNAHMIC